LPAEAVAPSTPPCWVLPVADGPVAPVALAVLVAVTFDVFVALPVLVFVEPVVCEVHAADE
jgi:hypothetical protein